MLEFGNWLNEKTIKARENHAVSVVFERYGRVRQHPEFSYYMAAFHLFTIYEYRMNHIPLSE